MSWSLAIVGPLTRKIAALATEPVIVFATDAQGERISSMSTAGGSVNVGVATLLVGLALTNTTYAHRDGTEKRAVGTPNPSGAAVCFYEGSALLGVLAVVGIDSAAALGFLHGVAALQGYEIKRSS